ncbi:hypothetical protein C8R42DRAFT_646178 [Lentinula raphanica]|nr:hypothetical protein C8R42DRAFT_646178 [Lentinula raphanica]
MAVPLPDVIFDPGTPTLARRRGRDVANVVFEPLPRQSWRVRYTNRVLLNPVLSDPNEGWKFQSRMTKAPLTAGHVMLGKYTGIDDENKAGTQKKITALRAKSAGALMAGLMSILALDSELPRFGLKFQPGGPKPGIPNSDPWAVFHDSKTMRPAEFREKYGCESEAWQMALGRNLRKGPPEVHQESQPKVNEEVPPEGVQSKEVEEVQPKGLEQAQPSEVQQAGNLSADKMSIQHLIH